MDLDAFAAVHGATWARLDELAKGRRRLSGAESDELVRLYQEVATHLSTIRSVAPDPAVVSRLSDILGRARAAIAGPRSLSWADLKEFLVLSLPAALYRIRWWTVAVMIGCLAVGVLAGVHASRNPDVLTTFQGSESDQQAYAETLFESYYSEHPHASFTAAVWTNNARIAALSIALGITGIGVLIVLAQNAVGVGIAGATMAKFGYLDLFFQLILPHGLLELTAIFVAGAAGLKLFWTMVDPGGRPRGRAVAEEGRALFTVALGLVIVLGVSGVIEGFVTPSPLPWPVKIAIGALALAGFWVYVLVVGRRAVRGGATGDLRQRDRGDALPLAA